MLTGGAKRGPVQRPVRHAVETIILVTSCDEPPKREPTFIVGGVKT